MSTRRTLLRGLSLAVIAPTAMLSMPVVSQTLPAAIAPAFKPLHWDETEFETEVKERLIESEYDEVKQARLLGMLMVGILAFVHDGGKDVDTQMNELEEKYRKILNYPAPSKMALSA